MTSECPRTSDQSMSSCASSTAYDGQGGKGASHRQIPIPAMLSAAARLLAYTAKRLTKTAFDPIGIELGCGPQRAAPIL